MMANKTLFIYLDDQLAGNLVQEDSGAVYFTYAEEFLNQENSRPLSQSLPLQQEAFNKQQTANFFSGFLLEDIQRELVAKSLQVSTDNYFALLEKLAGDCAGTISVRTSKKSTAKGTKAKVITELDIKRHILEQKESPALVSKEIRLSLAGAQSKFAITKLNDQSFYPSTSQPSP